jgi:hypothetical protein
MKNIINPQQKETTGIRKTFLRSVRLVLKEKLKHFLVLDTSGKKRNNHNKTINVKKSQPLALAPGRAV